jgi:hypothetical protein
LQLDFIAAVGREVPAPVHSYDLHVEAIIVNPNEQPRERFLLDYLRHDPGSPLLPPRRSLTASGIEHGTPAHGVLRPSELFAQFSVGRDQTGHQLPTQSNF